MMLNKINNNIMSNNDSIKIENITCVICLTEFSSIKKLIRIPCKRGCSSESGYCHPKCLYEWIQSRRWKGEECYCPLCRGELNNLDQLSQYVSNILSQTSIPKPLQIQSSIETRKRFVCLPLSINAGIIRCYIRVRKSIGMDGMKDIISSKMINYDLYYQSTKYLDGSFLPKLEYPRRNDTFLLTAKNYEIFSSSFRISLDIEKKDFNINENTSSLSLSSSSSSHSSSVIAVLNGSTLGTEYSLLSTSNCVGFASDETTSSKNNELVGIAYKLNLLNKDPKSIRVCFPTLSASSNNNSDNNKEEEEDDECREWKMNEYKSSSKSDSLASKAKSILSTNIASNITQSHERQFNMAYSRNGVVNKDNNNSNSNNAKSQTLNFSRRTVIPSTNNFQLLVSGEEKNALSINSDDDSGIIDQQMMERVLNGESCREVLETQQLNNITNASNFHIQFGKIIEEQNGVSVYCMDVQYPFSILQSFGICLSAIDRKFSAS